MTGRIGMAEILVRLAWRNVRRQARRSALIAAAMILGLALLVFSRALADGGHEDWITAGVRLGGGHVAAQNPDFQGSREVADHLSADELAAVHAAMGEVAGRDAVAVTDRISVEALANAAAGAVPVVALGVDPGREASFSPLAPKVMAGRYLKDGDRLAAFVGKGLAERLHLRVGSRLVLTAQDARGEMTGQFVRVVGIFRLGIPEVDRGVIHMPIAMAQTWLGIDGATSVNLLLRTSRATDRVVAGMRRALANQPTVAVLPWPRVMPELDAAVRIDDFGFYVFEFILFVIVALAIVNAVLMSVLYRTREFGILQAMGLTGRQTGALVLIEGTFLTVASGVIGVVVGLAGTWLFFRHGLDFSFALREQLTAAGIVIEPVIVPMFRMTQVVQSVTFVVMIGVFSSLYPAFRATRIDVALAMKFEA